MARNQKYVFPSTARHSTRSSRTYFHSLSNSDIGLSRNGRAGSAGGVRRMARLAVNPTAASATRIAPDQYCRPSKASAMNPAAIVPVMIATNVPNSRTPFPHESRLWGRISGKRPYFDGPNSAACVLSRNTAAIWSGRLAKPNAANATNITPISITFVPAVTERLLKRSPRNPPVIEKRMKGMENRSPTTTTRISR